MRPAAKILACMAVLLCISLFGNSQILKNLGNRVKQKVEQRVDQKTDQAIDKGLDKTEEAGKNVGKKQDSTVNPVGNNSNSNNKTTNSTNTNGQTTSGSQVTTVAEPSFQTYSKFDYIPGEKVIAYDDFSNDAIGDFPVTWNTNSAGEVVTASKQEGHWLMVRKPGRFVLEYIKSLPDNFTFEYDVICNDQFSFYSPALSLFFSDRR